MENPDLTIKEYIELEAKRAQISSEHAVSPLNDDRIDFRILFDESDDEDYICIYEKNSFSYKLISVNDLKTDSKKDINEVNLPHNDVIVEQLEDIVDVNVPMESHEFNEDFETNRDIYHESHSLRPQAVLQGWCLRKEFAEAEDYHLELRGIWWLTYEVEGYTKGIVQDYEHRLAMIFSRQVNHVHILDFEGLTDEMREGLTDRLRMIYTGGEEHVLFTSHSWRRLFEIQGSLVREFMLEFFSTCRTSDTEMGLDIADTTWGLLGVAPSYTLIRDPLRRICHKLISFSISGRAQAPEKVTATDLIYLRSINEGTVVTVGSPEGVEGALNVDEGVQVISAPVQAPQAPPPAASRTMPKRMTRIEDEVHGLRESLNEQHEVMDAIARDFSRATSAPHQDLSPFNQNYIQQPMTNPDDITDPTTAMNMALALMAKAFKLNYSTPTKNNQRISSNPNNRQIAQPDMNMGQDRQIQMVGGNGGNQFRQYAGQNAGNLNGNQVTQNPRIQNNGNQNQIGNGNLVAVRAEGNAAGHNGNQIRCYNCRGVGHFARDCTVKPKRRDAAYLQTQLLIAQKEEVGIQLQAEECNLMAAAADLDEIEEVNANCILMANLQQ
nr:hypothetical protein [Tanacetum cinerariifolium]